MRINYQGITNESDALKAVEQAGWALRYAKEQTEAICLKAVEQAGWALSYVKEQTEAICLKAVEQDGLALSYVKEQTEAVCLKAVEQDGLALRYVKEQTEAICLKAVEQNGLALSYVLDLDMFKRVAAQCGIETDQGKPNDPGQKSKEFEAITRPVIEWLNKNCNPHTAIHIEATHAVLYDGEIGYTTDDYVKG